MKQNYAKQKTNENTTSMVKLSKQQLKTELERTIPNLQKVATKHLQPERMIQLALRSAVRNPKILQCTPTSILGCVFESQTLGLEIDSLGQGYIVPFKNKRGVLEAQYIIGYKGLINLAQRTDKIASIHADLVREEEVNNGFFDYAFGSEYFLRHKPMIKAWDKDYKDVALVYAYAKLKDGGFYFVVLPKSEIEKTRLSSPSGRLSGSAWATDWDEMAKKTAIRKLSKYLPMSIEYERALKLDEMVATGQRQNLDINRINEIDNTLEIGEDEYEEVVTAIAEITEPEPKQTEPIEEPDDKTSKKTTSSKKSPAKDGELFSEEDIINWETVGYVVDQINSCETLDDITSLKHNRKKELDAFGGADADRINSAFMEKVRILRGL